MLNLTTILVKHKVVPEIPSEYSPSVINQNSHLEQVANNINEGLMIVEDGLPTFISTKFCSITGYTSNELKDISTLDLAAPEEHLRLKRILSYIRQTGIFPNELQFWIVRKDGIRRFIKKHYSLIYKDADKISFNIMISDITEAELKREQEELFHHNSNPYLPKSLFCIQFLLPIDTTKSENQQIRDLYEYGYLALGNELQAESLDIKDPAELNGLGLYSIYPPTQLENIELLRNIIRAKYDFNSNNSVPPSANRNPNPIIVETQPIIKQDKLYRIWFSQYIAPEDMIKSRIKTMLTQTSLMESKPIVRLCAKCKSVKDANNHWHQLDQLLSEGLNARVSHSLCPECAMLLYPEFYPKDHDNQENID